MWPTHGLRRNGCRPQLGHPLQPCGGSFRQMKKSECHSACQILKTVLCATAVAMLATAPGALGQPATPASVLPTGGGLALIDTSDSVVLLLDHQSGLFQTVKDVTVTELRNNTVMSAKLATLLKIPVITTASEPNGPNGPLMPEIHEFAPHAVYVGGKGEGERLGQRGFRQGGEGHRQEDADNSGRLDERLCHVPGAGREGGRVQGLRGDGRLGRSQRASVANHAARDSGASAARAFTRNGGIAGLAGFA